jgi:hypothetical protein
LSYPVYHKTTINKERKDIVDAQAILSAVQDVTKLWAKQRKAEERRSNSAAGDRMHSRADAEPPSKRLAGM